MYVTSYYESGLIGERDSHVISVMLHVSKTLDTFLIYRFLFSTLDQWRIDQSNGHSQIEFSFRHAPIMPCAINFGSFNLHVLK